MQAVFFTKPRVGLPGSGQHSAHEKANINNLSFERSKEMRYK